MNIIKFLQVLLLTSIVSASWAKQVVNVYVWGGEIPERSVREFEKKTGISVNFSTFDNNETMYAKIKASKTTIYDVIMPSAYYVERMKKQNLLTELDKSHLPNLNNLDKNFIDNEYDRNNQFSVPLTWGATGIFYNQKWIKDKPVGWSDLWKKNWKNQLLLLDDPRETFSIGLMHSGFNPNDSNPLHIETAYQALLKLVPNIKLFASDNLQAILIDEDALLGVAWNGDAFKAHQENPDIDFVYPEEGFVIWVDCLAIPKNAPHLKEAYEFINFMLRPQSAKDIAQIKGYAITNAAGKKLLPTNISENKTVYPDENILKKGYFQRDVPAHILVLYNKYWEQFKLSM